MDIRAIAPVLLALLALGSAAVPATSEADPSQPAALSDERQRTELHLPFLGTWIVGQGYNGTETHRGRAAFALDFVKIDENGSGYARRGRRVKDWYGFGTEVLASAGGTVVRAIDRFPDNRVLGKRTEVNTIIIQHEATEFSEYVHLQRGSLRVKAGDRVERGQVIARCGNSGSETPHLHWALLSSIDPIRTRPAVFSNFEIRDEHGAWRAAAGATPRSGEVIRPLQP